jgi:hypothetical protein
MRQSIEIDRYRLFLSLQAIYEQGKGLIMFASATGADARASLVP